MVGAYLVGDPSAADAVVVAADAPGWRAPGVRRFARLLHRASGALVVVPDLARGDTWYGDPDPAKRTKEKTFLEWRRGHPAERVAADAAAVGVALRERGATRVAAVGVGSGAGAVAALLGKRAGKDAGSGDGAAREKKKNEDDADGAPTDATMDAGAVACAVHLDAASAGRAAASGVPVLFVWGGGDGAAAAKEATDAAAEETAGASAPAGGDATAKNLWRSVSFGDADEHFCFFGADAGAADDADARVVDAANEIVRWMFRE